MARALSLNKAWLFAACAALLLALGVGAAWAQQAQRRAAPSGWSLCNDTSYVLEAATGRPDGRAIIVQGWYRLRPGECQVAVAAPLVRGTYYLYARSSLAHRGGRRQWGGDATLCVEPTNRFNFENPPQCEQMGLDARKFRRVNINRRESWRTSFAEATPYTPARAQAAGLQRLLSDAGYEVREGRSGVDPRDVAAALAQFRAAARIAPNTAVNGYIDALETAARRRSGQLGLTLCNHTNARLWTAVARRRGDGWESRGWWPLSPGGCARTIDDTLNLESYYVSAIMESTDGDRVLASGSSSFCISPARFAILGRERCEDRYYDIGYFTRINTTGRQGLVVEFSEREFLPPGERPQIVQASDNLPDTVDTDTVRRGFAPEAAPTQRGGGRQTVQSSARGSDEGSGD